VNKQKQVFYNILRLTIYTFSAKANGSPNEIVLTYVMWFSTVDHPQSYLLVQHLCK